MPDSRKARRIADPGLQPERTSLAWFRTMLGYGAFDGVGYQTQLAPGGHVILDFAIGADPPGTTPVIAI
ncbi:DUF202 domain-containing protein [Escherichia coli]|nr:DUF202 domain-containing protein [Escherichia coli]UBO60545.1 DUF202 domain-containing protein [Escherichia coli]